VISAVKNPFALLPLNPFASVPLNPFTVPLNPFTVLRNPFTVLLNAIPPAGGRPPGLRGVAPQGALCRRSVLLPPVASS
jgi:hypothetical protein